MNNNLISIITPTWNGMPYLKQCVESVLMQDFNDWELLISDDGSTDGSREFLASLNDPRIRVFEQAKNLGIFGNLNFLFEQANGPITQILCQDDYFTRNDSLRVIAEYWEKAGRNVGFVRFNAANITNRKQRELPKEGLPDVITSDKAAAFFYIFGNLPGNLSNVSLRTSIVKENNQFDQKLPYAGDFDFWSRAAGKADMGFDSNKVIYVRRHEGVASNHLNVKGELLAQKVQIINRLYQSLLSEYPHSKRALKLHGTICFDSVQRSHALSLYMKGNKAYLKALDNAIGDSSFLFRNKLILWGIFLFTLGGRLGRGYTAQTLFKEFHILGR